MKPVKPLKRWLTPLLAAALVVTGVTMAGQGGSPALAAASPADNDTTTPIKHVVVIFDENISFDHYFGTYPYAANTDGTPFTAAKDTPRGIETMLGAGLVPGNQMSAHNPNAKLDPSHALYIAPNPNQYQPQRLTPSQAVTCGQNHSYGPEQSAINGGRMDNFAATSSSPSCATGGRYGPAGLSMQYYDGNTVTALWNYAQNYAMSDNNWNAVFGPSTPGALNLISGNTYTGSTTIVDDPDPNGDTFGTNASKSTPSMYGANIGDLLDRKGVSWGWFQGGFDDEAAQTTTVAGAATEDYSPHHAPFQYYASTANPDHTPPVDGGEVGHDGAANHGYDLSTFDAALTGTPVDGVVPRMPAVSYLKAPVASDGHSNSSNPLDEQHFLTSQINAIQQSDYWDSTAIVVAYDDSDGWYDHVAPVITNSSSGFSGDTTVCTQAAAYGVPKLAGQTGRCGPSQRLPLLVISPYAKRNYVSHVLTTQASVLRFIEDNWTAGRIDDISDVKGSFDATANSLDDMFDWSHPQTNQVLLDSTMYQPGITSCLGITDYSACINPSFGSVLSRPTAPTQPAVAPVIGVAHHVVSISAGSDVPELADFLEMAGATISSGGLAADLSGVDTDAVGSYPVTITGADGDIPAMNPQAVTVRVIPVLSVTKPVLTFDVGAAQAPSLVRTMAGASIIGGVMDLPDLTGVDFGTPGTYRIQITGSGNGLSAVPVPVTIVVQRVGAPPAIVLGTSAVSFAAGGSHSATEIASLAGAQITRGTLAPIDVSGIDFTMPGTYPVQVTGADGGETAAPVTLYVVVVAKPVITLATSAITVPAGAQLTSAVVLASAGATISSGALDVVDLTGVNTAVAGTYGVSITGADSGIAAEPRNVAITVQAAPTTGGGETIAPVQSHTGLKVTPKRPTRSKKATITVTVTAPGIAAAALSPGKVVLYDGSKALKTLRLTRGRATARLKLKAGKRHLRATYVGVAASAATGQHAVVGSSATLAVKVKRK